MASASRKPIELQKEEPSKLADTRRNTKCQLALAVLFLVVAMAVPASLQVLRQRDPQHIQASSQSNVPPAQSQHEDVPQAMPQGDILHNRQLLNDAEHTDSSRSLIAAAQQGHVSVVSALLETGVSIEPVKNEPSALLEAASHGHLAVTRLLLGRGANTEAVDPSQGEATSLIFASERGDLALVNSLLEHRAAPDKADANGLTPLLAASRIGRGDIVASLCAAGASTSVRQTQLAGYSDAFAVLRRKLPNLKCIEAAQRGALTPLFLATAWGHGEVVAALLQHSPAEAADACVFALASWQGNAELVALMLDHLPAQNNTMYVGKGEDAADFIQHLERAEEKNIQPHHGDATISNMCSRLGTADLPGWLHTSLLPAAAIIHQCKPRNRSHGGVLVVTDFVTQGEVSAFSDFVRLMLDGRTGRLHAHSANQHPRKVLSADHVYESTLIFWPSRGCNSSVDSRVCLLDSIGRRLRECPGVPPAFPKGILLQRPAIPVEQLQASSYHSAKKPAPSDARYTLPFTERTGQTDPVYSMHHDRSKKPNRFATVIIYLSSALSQADGGHTIFPFLASGSGDGPGVQARQRLLSLAAAEMQLKPGSLFWDTPAVQEAVSTLCEEVINASLMGKEPPCLAVAPTPGTAVIFFNWGQGAAGTSASDGLEPEWSNIHIGCPAYHVPKLAVQSFRELPPDLLVDTRVLPIIE